MDEEAPILVIENISSLSLVESCQVCFIPSIEIDFLYMSLPLSCELHILVAWGYAIPKFFSSIKKSFGDAQGNNISVAMHA